MSWIELRRPDIGFDFFNCLVTELAIFALLSPTSLLGATLCNFNTSEEIRLFAESSEDTRLPFDEPNEHFSQPRTLCRLQ